MSSPPDHGWKRPSWTREMLVQTMEQKTGVRIHVSTMIAALAKIYARRGRPKPTVESTWSKRAKNKRLRELRALVEDLPDDEVAIYEDEVDSGYFKFRTLRRIVSRASACKAAGSS